MGRPSIPPEGYRLRNSDPGRWLHYAQTSGLVNTTFPVSTGDVLLIEPGPGQQHLLIAETQEIMIHAHAGLRRVVRQLFDFKRNIIAHWRLP